MAWGGSMKKGLFLLSLIVTFYALGTVSASAVTNDTVKVGLRYGSSVMSSANLENDEGSGYEFGYFEDDRTFVSLGETDETAITMEPAGRDGRARYSGVAHNLPDMGRLLINAGEYDFLQGHTGPPAYGIFAGGAGGG